MVGGVGGQVVMREVDSKGESVVVEIGRRGAQEALSFSIVAQLQ